MARITKASLEEFAKEVAALEAAEATILSPEEMERYAVVVAMVLTPHWVLAKATTKPTLSLGLNTICSPQKWGVQFTSLSTIQQNFPRCLCQWLKTLNCQKW